MPVAYDASKDCPTFKKFINEILSPEDVQGVQEELGQMLYEKYMTKKLSIYVGGTDTGKTTLVSVLIALLGLENVSSVSIQELASKNPFYLAQLFGKMANIRDDVSKDIVSSVGKLKELTGGFQVNAQKKFRDPFNFVNRAYLIFTCNYLPPVEEDDDAFYNRVMIRHFNKRFGGKDKPDRELIKKLTAPDELSGILNWGLEGLQRLRSNGWNFTNTTTSDATREEYKRQSDPVWAYVSDCLEEDSKGVITKERLYNTFKEFCEDKAIPLLSRDFFFKTLPEKVHVTSGRREVEGEEGRKHCFIGIKFSAEYLLNKKKVGQTGQAGHDTSTPVQRVQPVQGSTNLIDAALNAPSSPELIQCPKRGCPLKFKTAQLVLDHGIKAHRGFPMTAELAARAPSMSITPSESKPVRPLEVRDATELANHYGVPAPLVNLYFCIFNNRIYAMEPFLILMAQRKGIQRISLTEPVLKNSEWTTECRIYPTVPDKVLQVLPSLSPDQQKALLDYYMQPTVEWRRASKETVKAGPMQPYLREMSIKRAVTRACRKFSGIDFTSFEELPEAQLSEEQLAEARKVVVLQPSKPVVHIEQVAAIQPSEPAAEQPAPQPTLVRQEVCCCGCPEKPHIKWDGTTQCLQCQNKERECSLLLPDRK
jgi:P4 family phage/plasmid primase-like protien